MILEIVNQVGVPEVQELSISNSRKEFKITTDVEEIDGIKGGSISGEDKNPYEIVKYGDSSTQEIKMIPDEGYEIIKITINGEEILDYEVNEDGSYILPQFTNVTEDKHIVVTYALSTNKITLNKVDSGSQEPLTGAKFKLDQIEERTEPNAEEIFGELTDNGAIYTIADIKNEITTEGIIGELTDNGTYYFVENEDGSIVPTNSKTYQLENGGTAGVGSTTAHSYIKIDLSGLEGEYVVVANAYMSSQSSDYGYATITQSETAPSYNSSTGRFIYMSGTVDSSDYTSSVLTGGNIYYLHLGYYKNASTDTNEDRIVFNSIKLYKATTTIYGFDEIDGVYKSNNQGKDSTTANSYIELDLSNLTGKYNLTVNAEISSQSGDYGYVTVNNTETAPSYSSSTGRFIYISGEQEATDYTTVLQGGQVYYLHFGYYKNSTTSSGEDTFTINSVNLSLNDSDLYHTEVKVDGNGQAITQVPYGKYLVTEVETPEGYVTMKPITIEFREDGNSIVTDENNVQATVNEAGEFVIPNDKQARVIVHHYLRDNDGTYTTTKLAEDEVIVGDIGETYTTSPNLNITGYELIKDEEGNYIIPDGNNTYYESAASTGTYQSGDIEVIYYYEEAEIPLTVHHYIEGTTTPVPLKDGTEAQDVTDSGKEGEKYQTSEIEDQLLSDNYEIAEIPENAEGTYSGDEVIVTYYYKLVERPVTIIKTGENGKPLEGVEFEIQTKEDDEPKAKIEQNGTYYFIEQNGKYISNNQNKNSTTANSYIKIDLTGKEDVKLTINAEVSSESGYDYGYATVTESETAPSYSSSAGRFIYISGQVAAKDYETTLEGGKVYYLHLGYRKDGSGNTADDTFKINSIKINEHEILCKEIYTTDAQGKITTTLPAGEYVITETETPEEYQLPENSTQNLTVTKEQDSYELNISNDLKQGTVTVHHYIYDKVSGRYTEIKVPLSDGSVAEDEVKTGNVGEIWASKAKENLAENYELYEEPEITSGLITEEPQEITYYYVMKDAEITSTISKTGTDKITSKDEVVNYTVEYNATINLYVGDALVTITDTLPYRIDEEKSNLNGGVYNGESKTITWTEEIENINTTVDGPKTISISKNISVVFIDLDVTEPSFVNSVIGKVDLDSTGQTDETDPDEATTTTEFKVDVTVTKTWDHTNNIYTIPDSVILQVKNGDKVVRTQTVTSANAVDGNTNIWSYTFTGLDKYDVNGNEIVYIAGEAEVTEGNLDYYKASIDGTNITNTYDGPVISQSKSFTTENGQSYVVEGEKITYTVTVKNDGGVAKDVVVSDTIPEGTTFVDNSVKVNDTETGYTESDLSSGITVNVDKKSETIVSFEVTVDNLPDGTYLKELRNTAVVDGNNTNETTTVVNKSNLTFEKSSDPESGSEVKVGDEITYTITLNNSGTLTVDAIVKDSIPEGTTFVNGSIKVNDVDTDYGETDLTETGIRIPVGASETVRLSFKVIVNDLDNGAIIRNVATVNDTSTNEVTHEYVEPEITSVKSQYTENGLDYVVPGEKIIYTIIAKNSGGLDKNVVIQDTVPSGTTFVEGSIKVNTLSTYNETDLTTLTADDLANGITVNVPKGSATAEGFVRLSFEVTVNSDTTGEIRNIGTVDGEETNEVTKPVLTTEKVSSVIRHDPESTLTDNQVTVNDQIRYTVRVTNTGTTAISNVEVKDTIPTGTKLISIDNEGVQEDDEITWNIASIAGGKTQEVSFTVKVEYAKDNFTITNVATVDGKETNETENPYVKPDPELESTLTKNGTDKVTSKDQTVNYEVKFTASIDDFKGTAKVTLVDTLPYAIDISSSKLDNGTYNSENNTITWEEEIDVDTFSSDAPKDIVITKSIEVVYLYGDINTTTGSMLNTVDSKIELIEDDTPVTTDEKEAEKETLIEIPAEVIVHHYIYDEETDTYTTVKLAPDETINGLVGQDYTTSKSSQVPSNYSCINEQPNNYQGKMTEETIEVNYYYSLITPTITNTMDKTADPSVLTTEGGEVTYNIRYAATIDNYMGKATVSIVDTLPAEINIEKSDLGDGIYDLAHRTITWEEEIDSIDTFTNRTYNYEFERTISLVYTGQNMSEDLTNTVVGTVNVYYPENHPTKPDEVQETETAEDTEVVEQDYKVDLKVEKVWDDNNNEKGHRPDGIMVTIAGGDIQDTVVELNDSNNWSYEEKGLDKYDEQGNEITYSVAESEKNPGDLQYYSARLTELSIDDQSVKSYRFTNTYKLTQADLDANITKTGTEEITSSTEPVDYEINFTSTVKDYIGDGKVIITDTLPYRIDLNKSNIDNGLYDDEAKTITWEEELNNIDTFANGDYAINITKNISVVFVDLDANASSFTNTVLGKVRLYETEQEDQATDETDTLININGDVIVKYVDIDTGEEISDREEIEGKVGDKYLTEQKEIDTYEFVKSTPNTEGNITEETQEVIYYYQRKDATVIVKYQDTEGNELTEDIVLNGKVGDDYTTEQKEFEDYEFVSVTDNAEGTMKEDTITVIYVYQQTPTKVIVKYLEKGTDKQLALDDEIDGFVGDDYTTDRKAIKNYQSADPEPDNKSGTMTKDTITVIYYYERIPAGEVIVKYVDIDTDEEILYKNTETGEDKTYGYTISGFVGDNYEAEQKDIPYYNFIRSTSNTTGQLTEAGDTVIYYYQKQKFNLGITKSISEITLDGSNKGVGDGKNTKVEIHRKKINTANLEVKYKIVVSNTGEISGTAKVIDALPSGYIVSSNNPTYWTSSNGSLETTVELQPGESKELEVVLKWVNGETSFGTGENIARITDITNPANYAETTTQDNEDTATIVTSVETGINRNVYLIITTYLLMIGLVVLLYLYEQYQKERKAEIVPKKTLKLKRSDDKK